MVNDSPDRTVSGCAKSADTDALEHELFVGPMTDYPHLRYSMKAVRRAGERLAGDIVWTPEDRAAILETFTIANSWRDSHVYPMRSVRMSVIQRMRHAEVKGFTAARPKRMPSIRKKLRRIGVQLEQINDLGGCRAVIDDIEGLRRLISHCRDKIPHELRQEYDYISGPKMDGYRSHHMVFRFRGRLGDSAAFDGRRIELQLRTRLQHSWATAVEAVGLYRGEDMKAGQGDTDWLRLFSLISAEFACSENCALPNGIPPRAERTKEIGALNGKLRAAGVLEDIKNVTNFVKNFIQPPPYARPRYYLIRYEQESHTVTVHHYHSAVDSAASLGTLEMEIEAKHIGSKAVLVEVDKAECLVDAYPNYFGDVSLFIKNIKNICDGQSAIEYSMAPQSVVAPPPYEKPDLSWLRHRHRAWK